jgi:25S rRNA (adenine2142-N1)-methyltransferase
MTFEHLKAIMESLGFSQIREKWRPNGKMAYWLYQKSAASGASSSVGKKVVLRQGNRNNFSIII